ISSRYASFFFQVRGDIFFFPKLIQVGADEPYEKYLKDLIRPIRETKGKLDYYKNTGDSKYREFETNYNGLIEELEDAILFLQDEYPKYDFKSDTSLTDLAVYYELGKTIEIFRKYNFHFSIPKTNSQTHILDLNFDNYVICTIKRDHRGEMTNNTFESLEFSDKLNYRNNPLGHQSFYGKNTSFKKYNDITVGVLRGFGFETVSHLITIWNLEEDQLKLGHVLNKTINVGIGGVTLDTLVTLSDQRRLLIGTKSGGDGGDVWGSFWIAEWTQPNNLKIAFEEEFSGSSESFETINYEFLNDSTISLNRVLRIWNANSYSDSTISKNTLNILKLEKAPN
ncbi:MAG: hypothetical protein RIF34_05780, partial [Candidatus Kapaibacterium sp.]